MQVPAFMRTPGSNDELTIKATHTGIVFLGKKNEENKFESSGRYGKRYTGSKTCAVDINGGFWESKTALEEEVKASYRRFKGIKDVPAKNKKNATSAGSVVLNSRKEVETNGGNVDAISVINPDSKSLSVDPDKKIRKKAYKVKAVEVRHRLYNYINTQKGKKRLFFWTVSFPEGTPDNICHKLFNVWLTQLRKYNLLHDYLWIKERQDGKRAAPGKQPTHTLHFHIAIPHYLDVHKANAMMRGTLKTYAKRGDMPGTICNEKTGAIYFLPCISKYNGVHISKHKKTGKPINFAIKKGSKALAHYLTKYLTKKVNEDGTEEEETYEQLAWHNSRGFSCLFTGITFTIAEFQKCWLDMFLDRSRVFVMRFAVFVPWDKDGPPLPWVNHMYKLNSFTHSILDERRKKSTAAIS